MKANKVGKIKVPKSGYRRSRFNWAHDVNTTFSWGEIQPTQCKLLIPGSKTTMKAENLIRLAPMVAPTFGRVKYKSFSQFVPMEEVFPNLGRLLAQEPVSTGYTTKVPTSLPHVKLGILSQWVLHGARATLYITQPQSPNPAQEAAAGQYITQYKDHNLTQWNIPTGIGNVLTKMVSAGVLNGVSDPYGHSTDADAPDVGTRVVLSLDKMNIAVDALLPSGHPSIDIVLGADSTADLVPPVRGYEPGVTNAYTVVKPYEREVTMNSADYVIEGSFDEGSDTYYIAIAFELSDFGKRLKKIIQGCGYQINFVSTAEVCLLPLLAQYKAYFDVFGLELYHGWETTKCYELINQIKTYVSSDFTMSWFYSQSGKSNSTAIKFWKFFLNELGQEFYTEDPDYIGAHIERLSVSPNVDTSGFISVDSSGFSQNGANITEGDNTLADGTVATQNEQRALVSPYPGIAYIDQTQHGQVDAELLKRIYKWTNRNTVLGRKIAELLRAQGLGKYVDECKSYFIGATDNLVTISDVVSTAATSDAVLGEFGGKGLQYVNHEVLSFENDEYGYWITLATVVPEAGWTQGLDPTLTSLTKFDLYQPDFDAVGMEETPKQVVCSTNYDVLSNTIDAVAPTAGFGFVPKMSKFKVCGNLVNGDFSRHGLRSVYMPYTLDKQLNINDFNVKSEVYDDSGSTTFNAVELNRSARVGALPVAGDVWRTPTKYAWMGNFDRIFYNLGERESEQYVVWNPTMLVGFDDYNNDNFLSHGVYDVNCYAPMKPIEDSYGLEEDDPEHAGAEYLKKA